MSNYKTIEELKGKTLVSLEHNDQEAVFATNDGKRYQLYHGQNCCESVVLESVEGDISKILNEPIIVAREAIGHDDPTGKYESVTFSDFHISTEHGQIVLKWVGESNGYYSESVEFIELP